MRIIIGILSTHYAAVLMNEGMGVLISIAVCFLTKNKRHIVYIIIVHIWCVLWRCLSIDPLQMIHATIQPHVRWVYDLVRHSDNSGFTMAMIFGQARECDRSLIQAIQFLGIYHVLVISGLHINYVFNFLRQTCRLPQQVVYGLMLGLLLVSGLNLPSVRAFASLLLQKRLSKRFIKKQLLIWLVVCIIFPNKVLSASLFLSMTASIYLGVVFRQGSQLFWAHVGVQMVLWPILHFFEMNTSSWSWCIAPCLSPFIMIHASVNIVLSNMFAFLKWHAATLYLTALNEKFVVLFCSLDELLPDRGINSWPWQVCVFAALVAWAGIRMKRRWHIVLVGLLLMGWSYEKIDRDESMKCFEVGHGLSCLFWKGSRAILYDTARKKPARLIKQFMRKNHIFLDAIILSHSDLDHAGGIWSFLSRLKLKGQIYGSPITVACRNLSLKRECVKITRIKRGHGECFGGLCFKVLHPDRVYNNENQTSLVVKLIGHKTFLLTGDIDKKILSDTLQSESAYLWRADYWLPPHHERTLFDYDKLGWVKERKIMIGKTYRN